MELDGFRKLESPFPKLVSKKRFHPLRFMVFLLRVLRPRRDVFLAARLGPQSIHFGVWGRGLSVFGLPQNVISSYPIRERKVSLLQGSNSKPENIVCGEFGDRRIQI